MQGPLATLGLAGYFTLVLAGDLILVFEGGLSFVLKSLALPVPLETLGFAGYLNNLGFVGPLKMFLLAGRPLVACFIDFNFVKIPWIPFNECFFDLKSDTSDSF